MADLPATPLVVVTPEVGVSTPQAFRDWDELVAGGQENLKPQGTQGFTGGNQRLSILNRELTQSGASDRLLEVGRVLCAWLGGSPNTGAPAKGGSRAGSLLLDLVRTGIENDFEKVVFPKYPELRDIKRALEGTGARYASLSGSGSTLYGVFASEKGAVAAARRLRKQGLKAVATTTLTRQAYWKKFLVSDC